MSLPDAVALERDTLLRTAITNLQSEGYADVRAHELAGYGETPSLRMPVLNTQMQPDIAARDSDGTPYVACIEVSSDLSETDGGRRWQAFSEWARLHGARFQVFVHADDAAQAMHVADHWHIDHRYLRPVFTR
jgi:hypothetical protein